MTNTDKWPLDRREELTDLLTLLREVRTINNGSSALERIARCIELAEKLSKTDLRNGRRSFPDFLTKLAHGNDDE